MSTRSLERVAVTGLVLAIAACNRTKVPVVPGVPMPVPRMAAPRNGLEVVGWMHYAHPSRALKTLAFTVNVTDLLRDTSRTIQSRAHAALPGKLRVSELPA